MGGVKVDGSTIVIDGNGIISSTGSGGSGYTLPTASTSILGGVKVDGTTITINNNGVISASSSTNLTDVSNYLTAIANQYFYLLDYQFLVFQKNFLIY